MYVALGVLEMVALEGKMIGKDRPDSTPGGVLQG
jgi:hypothetical protein